MIKVILADDEELVRYFLRTVLEKLSYDIVAEVEKGDKLYNVMQEKQPDMLSLHINMPNLSGIEFLKKYTQEFPKTCIIILTSAALTTLIGESSLIGVKCFLRKDTPVDEMLKTIEKTWLEFQK